MSKKRYPTIEGYDAWKLDSSGASRSKARKLSDRGLSTKDARKVLKKNEMSAKKRSKKKA